MIRQQSTIRIDQPVEKVFAYVTNGGNLGNWQSHLVKHEPLGQEPLRVGSRFREVRRMGPREAEIKGEVTALEAQRHFATKTLTKPEATVDYLFVPESGGTRLTYNFALMPVGLMRLLQPLIASGIKKDTEADLERLKRLLEG